jgi:hypothetical protein
MIAVPPATHHSRIAPAVDVLNPLGALVIDPLLVYTPVAVTALQSVNVPVVRPPPPPAGRVTVFVLTAVILPLESEVTLSMAVNVPPADGEAADVLLVRLTLTNVGLGYDPVKSPPALPDGGREDGILTVTSPTLPLTEVTGAVGTACLWSLLAQVVAEPCATVWFRGVASILAPVGTVGADGRA